MTDPKEEPMPPRLAKIISADSHVREPIDLWWNTLGAKFGERTPRVITEHKGKKGRFFYTGRWVTGIGEIETMQEKAFGKELEQSGYVPEKRVKFQVDAGIEAEIMNPSPMLSVMQAEHADVGQACAEVFNDWLAEFCSHDPRRLVANGTVPMYDVDWAVGELQRIVRRGMKGAIINVEPPEGRPTYRDPSYDPFWAAAQDLDVPITLHIITGRVPDPILYFHTAKEHEDTPRAMLAVWDEIGRVLANEFIFGGVLDRFPRLKLVTSEYEVSWIPSFMFRIDQMQDDFSPRLPLPRLAQRASDYMRTRVFHGLIDDPYAAVNIPLVGVDQILWGSDFPHVRSIGLDTQDRLAKMFETLTPSDQAKVVGGSAARLYKI
jgi:predicted TIM-barrel fold metal-dependent hydrolase